MASVEQSNSNILSTDEKKVGLFGRLESRYVWCKMNSISKNSQLTVKHAGGASLLLHDAVIDEIMNFAL